MKDDEYLASVREQYENYPYPTRTPEDEKHKLFLTPTEHIGNISHYGFSGKRDMRDGVRCLVAGGGTGDTVMFLGEQLRDTNTEIFYIDLSQASMEIARERAKVRGLNNITWHHRSLLELPNMDIGKFDYINCTGVLHHLEDPEKGLNALKSVLNDDGVMSIMLYGQYGRTGIYHMQELMREINKTENNLQNCVDNTHMTIAELPRENWYKRDEGNWKDDIKDLGDIEIYDLFLHSQDRAYTVPQVYQWLNDCDLNLVDFTGFPGQKLKYIPEKYIKNEKLLSIVNNNSLKHQQSIAELIAGNIKTHTFYVSKKQNTIADHMDNNMVPYYSFMFAPPEQLFNDLSKNPAQALNLNLDDKIDNLTLEQAEYTRYILRYLDGNRSLGEITQKIRDDFSSDNKSFNIETMRADYDTLFKKFHSYELMYVRSTNIEPYKSFDQLVDDTVKRHTPPPNTTGVSVSFNM